MRKQFSEEHLDFFHRAPWNAIDNNTLVIFDVDSVLTIPAEPILHPHHFQKYKTAVESFYQAMTRLQKHFVNHLIIAHPVQSIEPYVEDIIKSLQQKKIVTIGFTNAKKGRFSKENRNFSDVRVEQLQSIKIDFSLNAPDNNEYCNLNPTLGDYPSIEKGVIYSCGLDNQKGDVLREFLLRQPAFHKIYFFDDKKKNLDSVSQMIRQSFPQCEFRGFHYYGADHTVPSRRIEADEFMAYLQQLYQSVREWL